MDIKSDDKLIIMQTMIDDNRQASDKKMNTYDSKPDKITAMVKNMMVHNQNYNNQPDDMDSPKTQDPTAVVMAKKKATPLEGGHSTKNGGTWTL